MARCAVCNNLEKKVEDDVRLAFDFRPIELIKSSNDCDSCALLLEGIGYFENGGPNSWSFIKDITCGYAIGLQSGSDNATLSLELYFSDNRPKLVLEFFCQDRGSRKGKQHHRWKAIEPRTSINGHPLSPEGFSWVTSTLGTCLMKHSSCPSARDTLLPRRILVFDNSNDGKITVKLQENTTEKGRYNALSYCWGKSPTFTTTSEALSRRRDDMPWTSLPKTFQDSITFSLKLGIHYLWIDALCIIQDDLNDWAVESAAMGDIYQNAFLTLAATASDSGSGGCFPESIAGIREYEIKASALSWEPSSLMVREKLQHWTVPPTEISVRLHPLLSRGWAFQERILSPRVLHFSRGEMILECKEEAVCECGGLPKDLVPQKHFYAHIEAPNSKKQPFESTSSGDNSSTNKDSTGGLGKRERFRRSTSNLMRTTLTNTGNFLSEFGWREIPEEPVKVSKEWHSIIEQYSALQPLKRLTACPRFPGSHNSPHPNWEDIYAVYGIILLGQISLGVWIN